MAKRITYNRFKDGKLPTNTKRVDRGTRYGNPFKLDDYERDEALRLYEIYLDEALAKKTLDLTPLYDMDLACSCKPGDRCHADILLNRIKRIRNIHK